MDFVLSRRLGKETVSANFQHFTALLETAGKTAEDRLKTLPLLSFDFD